MNEDIDDDENTSLEKVEDSGGWFWAVVVVLVGVGLWLGAPKVSELYKLYTIPAIEAPKPSICRFHVDDEGGYYERQCTVVGTYAYINDGVQK